MSLITLAKALYKRLNQNVTFRLLCVLARSRNFVRESALKRKAWNRHRADGSFVSTPQDDIMRPERSCAIPYKRGFRFHGRTKTATRARTKAPVAMSVKRAPSFWLHVVRQ